MGLWYLTSILFLTFSGLFWVYSGDRINVTQDYKTGTGGLFYTCHQAGMNEVYATSAFGSAGVSTARQCRAGNTDLRFSDLGKNLDVGDVLIRAYRPAHVGDMSPQMANIRMVVTYLPPNTIMKGTPFIEVIRQVRSLTKDQASIGVVIANDGVSNRLQNTSGLVVRVPLEVPQGSFAMVTALNSAGCQAPAQASGGVCFRKFTTPVEYRTFINASNSCQATGGYLLKIRSEQDRQDLINAGALPPIQTWLDGYDTANNSQFFNFGTSNPVQYFLPNGAPAAAIDFPWSPGEPNNAPVGIPPQEDCIELYPSGLWNDINCNNVRPYICLY